MAGVAGEGGETSSARLGTSGWVATAWEEMAASAPGFCGQAMVGKMRTARRSRRSKVRRGEVGMS